MKIEVTRQACCSQDDQLGPLSISIEIDEAATIQSLAKEIGEAKFLQFSGTHSVINICSGGVVLLSIPALGSNGSEVKYFVNKYEPLSKYIKCSKVECIWPKNL